MLKEKIENRIKEKIKTELSYEEGIGGRYVLEWVLEELKNANCYSCKYQKYCQNQIYQRENKYLKTKIINYCSEWKQK